MLNSIIYSIKEAFKGMIRNQSMTLASIASVTTALFVFGIILCIVLNLNNITAKTQEQFNSLNIYLSGELSDDEIKNMGIELKQLEGVDEVIFESKEDALQNLKERWGEKAYLLDGIKNPLEDSYILKVNTNSDIPKLIEKIGKMKGIVEIRYFKDVVSKLTNFSNTINKFGLALMSVLILISIFIISITIRLTINARKNEIFIMKYIGATNWFVRWPFIIEGIILGLIGSIIAIALMYLLYKGIYNLITVDSFTFINGYILHIEDIFKNIASVFISMGVCIGTIGAVMSVRKYLEA